jgi:hypothetical protein
MTGAGAWAVTVNEFFENRVEGGTSAVFARGSRELVIGLEP